MNKIFIIAPDKSSGDAFSKKILDNSVSSELYYAKIAPRVVGNKINLDPQIEYDLKEALLEGYNRGFDNIVIACNTLQFWLRRAMDLLPQEVSQNIRVMTTFDALEAEYPMENKRPVLLGTTITVNEFKNFPTLISLGLNDIQDLVQEIIWRVKAVTGSDITTATADIKDISNQEILKEKTDILIDNLLRHNIKTVVLACTELPIAVNNYLDKFKKEDFEFIDPADLITKYLTRVK